MNNATFCGTCCCLVCACEQYAQATETLKAARDESAKELGLKLLAPGEEASDEVVAVVEHLGRHYHAVKIS